MAEGFTGQFVLTVQDFLPPTLSMVGTIIADKIAESDNKHTKS
jgi:hypothetical protein